MTPHRGDDLLRRSHHAFDNFVTPPGPMRMHAHHTKRTISKPYHPPYNRRELTLRAAGTRREDGVGALSVPLPPGSPAWLLALAIGASVTVALIFGLVRLARHMMPQDSSDRLTWWHERRAFREQRRRRRQGPWCGRNRRRPVGGTCSKGTRRA